MDSALTLAAALVSVAALFVTIARQLHMFQQNSYFYSRFFDYLKGNFKLSSAMSAVFAAISIALALINPLICLVFTCICCAFRVINAVYKLTHAKVKLKFTARVRRMYYTLALLCIIVFGGLFAFANPFVMLCIASVMLVVSPFVVMLVNLTNAPFEHSAKRWYINDAKKILKNHGKMTVIALTGSYGKTSTKYILSRILSEKFNVTITPGNFNTTMGVVRTIREHLKPDTQVFIAEMGAKKVGDIKEICDIVHADYGIITSIGPQHLNTFGSVENIVKTKFELADDVCKNGGTVYLNCDNDYICGAKNSYTYKGYGVDNRSEYIYAENIKGGKNGLQFDIVCGCRKINVTTKLLGRHNVLNILAAVAIAIDLGLTDTDIKYALEMLTPVEHRLQLKPLFGGAVLIDDAYNANPDGSLEAMRVIGSFAPMKRIVVTPGLVELGEREYECNKALGKAAAENADEIYFVGEERSKALLDGAYETDFDKSKIHVTKTFNDALNELKTKCDKNTVVIFENDLPDNYAK